MTSLLDMGDWALPKADLFHFIPVLNRLDALLADILLQHGFTSALDAEPALLSAVVQSKPFSSTTRQLLLNILHFTRLLMENSLNRSLYNSYEHLDSLLFTTDMDVLEMTLRLLLLPAKRLGTGFQSSAVARKAMQGIKAPHVLALLSTWGSKDVGFRLLDFATLAVSSPITFQFYRSRSTTTTTTTTTTPTTPTPQVTKEGMVLVPVQPTVTMSEKQLFDQLVAQYHVPTQHHLGLLHHIRLAHGLLVASSTSQQALRQFRQQFLIVRLLAIATYAFTSTESDATTQLFGYEPKLVQELVELLQMDNQVPYHVQAAALYTLESIAHYRGRLSDVLNAVNAAANHGILMFILRQVAAHLDSPDPQQPTKYPTEFIDALFSLLSTLITTQTGGSVIVSAGLIPVLVQFIRNRRPEPEYVKLVARSLALLDSVLYGFGQVSFQGVIDAGGLEAVVGRIESEMAQCVALAETKQHASSSEAPTSPMSPTSATSGSGSLEIIPHTRLALLKQLLKFTLHTLQSSSGTPQVRNLIETTLPVSIREILRRPRVFGATIYAMAVNMLAAFIHNEPASWAVLKEKDVPGAFLDSLNMPSGGSALHAHGAALPPSSDLLTAIPNALGAICLSPAGMDIVKQSNPFDTFFGIFVSPDHLRSLLDEDAASYLGNAVDELIRHHPPLRPMVMDSIVKVLKRIVQMGQVESDESVGTEEERTKAPYHLHLRPTGAMESEVKLIEPEDKPEDPRESPIVLYIESMARFLEGLFNTNTHCKDFLASNGMEIMFEIYQLPTLPYDFASSVGSYNLSNVFRMFSDIDSQKVLEAILTRVEACVAKCQFWMKSVERASVFAPYLDLKAPEDGGDALVIQQASDAFRSFAILHSHVGLLCDVYSSPMYSQNRTSLSIVQTLAGPLGRNVIGKLAELYRVCALESLYFKHAVPKLWIAGETKKTESTGSVEGGASGLSGPDMTGKEEEASASASSATAAAAGGDAAPMDLSLSGDRPTSATTKKNKDILLADPTDHRIKNTKYFKYLLTQTTAFIVPTFQGIGKMLLPRRADATQRDDAIKVAEAVITGLLDYVEWQRVPRGDFSSTKYHYFQICAGFIHTVITDERNENMLLTVLVTAYTKQGGIGQMFDMASAILADLPVLEEKLKAVKDNVPEKDRDEKAVEVQEETNDRACTALEKVLSVLLLLSTAKPLHDSHHTTYFMSRDRNVFSLDSTDGSLSSPFDPFAYLVSNRTAILKGLMGLWNDEAKLVALPASVLKLVLQIMGQILKADGETVIRKDEDKDATKSKKTDESEPTPFSILQSLMSNLRQEGSSSGRVESAEGPAQESRISQLTDMGFTRTAALTALNRSGQNVMRATEYLLMHPELMDVEDTPAASSSTAPAASGTDESGSSTMAAAAAATTAPAVDGETLSSNNVNPENLAENNEAEVSMEDAVTDDGNESYEDVDDEEDDHAMDEEDSDPDDEDGSDGDESESEGDEGDAHRASLSRHRPKTKEEKAAAEEAQKKTEQARKELDEMRVQILKDVPGRCLKLVGSTSAVLFEVRDMLVPLFKDNKEFMETFFSALDLKGRLAQTSECQALAIPLNLMALFASDASIRSEILERLTDHLAALGNMLEHAVSNLKTIEVASKVVSSILLLVETYISESEDIVPVPLMGKTLPTPPKKPLPAIPEEGRFMLSHQSFRLATMEDCDKGLLNAALRVLVLLTRNDECAAVIASQPDLFKLIQVRENTSFSGQTALIIILLRHLLENRAILQAQVEKDMIHWLTFPRERVVDVPILLKNFSGAICRNPDAFVSAAKNIVRLTRTESIMRPHQVALIKNSPTKNSDGDSNAKKEEETHPALTKHTETMQQELAGSEIAKSLVHTIMAEILAGRASNSVPQDSVENIKDESNSLAKPAETDEKKQDTFMQCFLLQTLSELAESFPPIKLHCLSFIRQRHNKDKEQSHRGFRAFLLYLMNDVIPTKEIPKVDDLKLEDKSRSHQSSWAMHLISVLCQGDGSEELKIGERRASLPNLTAVADYNTVRRATLECIIRSIRDAMSSPSTLDIKYGRYYAMSELISKILSLKPTSVFNNDRNGNDQVSMIARLMMEKNLVTLLTSMLGDLDLNFPDIRLLANTIVRPLESLTRLSNRVSRMSSVAGTPHPPRPTLVNDVYSSVGSSPIAARIQPHDSFIRDSALGMFSADAHRMDTSDDSSDEDGHIDMMDDMEDEVDEEGEFTDMSDEEMSDEEESEDRDTDMEVVIRTTPLHPDGGDDSDNIDTDTSSSSDDHDLDSDIDEEPPEWLVEEGAMHDMEPGETDFDDDSEGDLDDHFDHGMYTEDDEHEEEDEEEEDEDDPHGEEGEDMDAGNDDSSAGSEEDGWIDYDMEVDGHERMHFLPQRAIRAGGGPLPRPNRNMRVGPMHDMFQVRMNSGNWPPPILLDDQRVNASNWNRHGSGQPSLNDAIGQHPLLQRGEGQPTASASSAGVARSSRPMIEINADVADFDAGNALQFIEQLLNVNTSNMDVRITSGVGDHEVVAPKTNTRATSFHPCRNQDRWFQEARLMYGTTYGERAGRIQNAVLNELMPIAVDDEKKRREEEERVRKEKEAKRLEEQKLAEEKRKREAEEAAAAKAVESGSSAMEVEQTESTSQVAAPTSAAASENTITIHGTTIDLTNTGIDKTFLEALPDDLRAEVLVQHYREQREPGAEHPLLPDHISQEFLDALPEDIRDELTQTDAQRRMRQQNAAGNPPPLPSFMEFDGPLPSALREIFNLSAPGGSSQTRTSSSNKAATPKKSSSSNKEPAQLLDKQAITSLVRLLFASQSLNRTHLNQLISNLCENGKTRSDIIEYLVSLIQECSANETVVAGGDKKSKRMSLTRKTASLDLSSVLTPLILNHGADSVNNIAIQRSLDLIMDLASRNEAVAKFFLAENDNFSVGKSGSSKKGKQKATPVKYPLIVLLSLLERPVFLKNSNLMDNLTQLLATVTRPLATAADRAKTEQEKKGSSKPAEGEPNSSSSNAQ